MTRYAILGCLLLAGFPACPNWRAKRISVLAPPGSSAVPHMEGQSAILINGRSVSPAGRFVRTQSYNWGLALDRDESRAVLISRCLRRS